MSSGFTKIGELQVLQENSVIPYSSALAIPVVEERFRKFAATLRRIAPQANEFLYFSAIMMHAAEAALINEDGTPKLSAHGKAITSEWEKKGDSWKWVCSDSNVMPYKNSNGDIFPEEELLKASRNWIGKPLCTDHKSNSVDAIRGIILDTYYDHAFKRVIALCALDKVTYPDLAKKVSLGYSTCVSMGTAVGRAICANCGVVARTEQDFCHHMRTKSGYGEINVDLQPIELSIVVNGADPRAKIRTIIAAANTVNNHLASKEQELSSLAEDAPDHAQKLEELENDLQAANEKLAELKEVIDENSGKMDAPYGMSSGRYDDTTDETDANSTELNFPERFASNNDALIGEVKDLRASLERRLNSMEKGLDKLNRNKEETMSKDAINKAGYFQGGGGVNEPTPGQKKYPVDPKNEDMRSKDKHMVGESPFPEVGAVDGMHPSPESADQKDELERKKMLARAEQDERSMRRAAALQKAKENIMNHKEAYWQGGGGVNEPTPGQQKYPVDKLNEDLRDKKDKQMVGQKPFPGVGDVEGLHPSPESADQKDELARKKLLQRASLKARFVRVANVDGTDNLGDSAWQVYAKDESGEKLVFNASVDEISGGRSDVLFDIIATKDFGTKMLEKIRTVGLTKAAGVYKRGQAVAGPGAQPGMPADVGGAGAAPAMPDMGAPAPDTGSPDAGSPDAGAGPDAAPEDEGGKGDPKEAANKLAEKVRDMSSDLLEAVRSLTGEQAQMGDMEDSLETMPKAASKSLAPLFKMRKDLHAALLSNSKKALAELREHAEELDLIASVAGSDTTMNKEYVDSIVNEALNDAKLAVADAQGLLNGFSKYAQGTSRLVKRAEDAMDSCEDENDARKKAKKSKDSEKESKKSKDSEEDDNDVSYVDDSEESSDDESDADDFLNATDENLHMDDLDLPESDDDSFDLGDDKDLGDEDLDMGDTLPSEDMPADDMNDTMVELPPGSAVPSGAKAVMDPQAKVAFDLTTKEGRAAYRTKLAADATGKEEEGEHMDEASLPYTDMLDESSALTDGQTKLDVKPSDNLGLVETVGEQHKKDMEVAKAEPKVRKEAERLNQLISEGKVAKEELDTLISQGLDPEVVKYWKMYYGQAGKEGSEFGKLLTTETMKAKAAEEMVSFKVKVSRAYELANEMVRRGLLTDDRTSITAQVEEIMKWNDEGFDSMKRVVAKHAPLAINKQASAIPQVGLIGASETHLSHAAPDFQSELDAAFSNRKY